MHDANGREIGALRGVLASVMGMVKGGATHLAVATDHVIESFRNSLWPGYKTSEGVPPDLLAQFGPLEEELAAAGMVVWPMIEFEADDALAAAASAAARDPRVDRIFICTPDKDLAQCVVGSRVVQLDRRREILRDEAGVIAKWGVRPESIPDYLAVVGDSADGFPGLPGWGAKAAALTFAEYLHLEHVPKDWRRWPSAIRGAQRLAAVLFEQWDDARLYRTLATLALDVPVFETVDELAWKGPAAGFEQYSKKLGAPELYTRALAAIPL